jgi:hypothetical protein
MSLRASAPSHATGQRFNLWLGVRSGIAAPLVGVPLVEVTRGTRVNPFVLGCIATVLTKLWTERGEGFDWFGLHIRAASLEESIALATTEYAKLERLEDAKWLTTLERMQVEKLYAEFLRYSERMAGKPEPLPEPVPPVPPSPAPAPAPVPSPGPGKGRWARIIGGVATALGTAISLGAIFIPDQWEAILRLIVEALKHLGQVLTFALLGALLLGGLDGRALGNGVLRVQGAREMRADVRGLLSQAGGISRPGRWMGQHGAEGFPTILLLSVPVFVFRP